MSYNTINTRTEARQFRAKARQRSVSVRIPRHIEPGDSSLKADRGRYDLHAAMMRLNPKGWRSIGRRSIGDNRLATLARRGYDLKSVKDKRSFIMRLLSETWNFIKGAFTHE